MDQKKLEKANKISEHISQLNDKLKKWENAMQLQEKMLVFNEKNERIEVDTFYIDFDLVKKMVINSLKEELLVWQTEFSQL